MTPSADLADVGTANGNSHLSFVQKALRLLLFAVLVIGVCTTSAYLYADGEFSTTTLVVGLVLMGAGSVGLSEISRRAGAPGWREGQSAVGPGLTLVILALGFYAVVRWLG